MLIVQLLLPRFLVVEVVFFIHFIQGSDSCGARIKTNKKDEEKSNTCLIPVGKIDQEPLFYNLDGQYLLPTREDGASVISLKDKFMISCPSARLSFLGDGKKDVMEVVCVNDNKFKTKESNALEYNKLSCSRSIRESVQETQIKCGPDSGHGKIVHIGWNLPVFGFKPLITVCHDRRIDHSYFTNHTLLGKTVKAYF